MTVARSRRDGKLGEFCAEFNRCLRCHRMQRRRDGVVRAGGPSEAGLPVFRCLACDVHFRRTTGTPPSGLKFRKLELFVRLLSQQRPITDAAEMIDVKVVTVIRWVKRMRQWIPELDPSGYWEAKVRLGRHDALSRLCFGHRRAEMPLRQLRPILSPIGGPARGRGDLRHRAPRGEAPAVVTTETAGSIAIANRRRRLRLIMSISGGECCRINTPP